MIPQKTVQEILETAKVEEVVGDFVNLKRRGINMIGLCPFHNEKTPSFTVSPNKNIFKCFGCGQAGNATKFLMEHENMTFPEALRWLGRKYGIEIKEKEITPEMRAEMQMEESLFIVNDFALKYFQDTLFNTDLGKSVGLNYFKSRGFREDTIKKWGLGFTLDQKTKFTDHAQKSGYNKDLLQKLGLTSKYGQDFFRNRVMFTIRNLSGKVVAFAGRIMVKDAKAPKYINSPETEIYNKSKTLYGLHFAKKAIRKNDECIMVEGYTDVISLHQAGIENVVASSGTSLTIDQISLVKRQTQNIKILYDGDAAGVKAALRGLDMVLEQDLNVKVVLLPEGEDPDSYLNNVGTTAFREYIDKEAKDFILFKTSLLLEEAANDPVRKSTLIKDIVGSIARIPDPIKRSLYVKECARVMEVDEQVLVVEANRKVEDLVRNRQKERDRRRIQEERKRAQNKQQRPKPQAPQKSNAGFSADPSFPTTEYPISQEEDHQGAPFPDTEITQPQSSPRQTGGDTFQEKDIARILVVGGGEIFDKEENITVAEYILSNIEDVLEDFENPAYKKIADECLSLAIKKQKISVDYFTGHPDENISKTAIDLLYTPFEFSPGWAERDVFLQNQKAPEKNFTKDSISALKRFKLKKIIKMCDENANRLKAMKEAGENDITKIMRVMKVQNKLNTMRNQLAKELGTVVLKTRI